MGRRSSRGGIFWFALMIVGASVCAGGVAAWVTHFNIRGRQAGRADSAAAVAENKDVQQSTNSSGMTKNQRGLAKLTREQLEAEVLRLNGAVEERERQIDELKIQLKLAAEGSRSPR